MYAGPFAFFRRRGGVKMGIYSITISEDGTFIHVQAGGNITRELVVSTALEVSRLAKDMNIHKALLDFSQARNVEPVFQIYEMAYTDMNRAEIDKTLTLACLISPEDHSFDFLETVLRNAGFIFKLFTDDDATMDFLNAAQTS
jgi:hypothetical protein